jgi:large subunit ribosomal protein L18
MAKTQKRTSGRIRRKKSIRKSISGTSERPRLSVFRSSKNIYAQIIDDDSGKTLAAASTLSPEVLEDGENGGNRGAATKVGALIAEKAKVAGVELVSFDRNGYLYHGRVKALADGAREGGLKF